MIDLQLTGYQLSPAARNSLFDSSERNKPQNGNKRFAAFGAALAKWPGARIKLTFTGHTVSASLPFFDGEVWGICGPLDGWRSR
jgi:hypothetical protein